VALTQARHAAGTEGAAAGCWATRESVVADTSIGVEDEFAVSGLALGVSCGAPAE
jgi:hypothetical protein